MCIMCFASQLSLVGGERRLVWRDVVALSAGRWRVIVFVKVQTAPAGRVRRRHRGLSWQYRYLSPVYPFLCHRRWRAMLFLLCVCLYNVHQHSTTTCTCTHTHTHTHARTYDAYLYKCDFSFEVIFPLPPSTNTRLSVKNKTQCDI